MNERKKKIIVLDVETTGLDCLCDEILQLSIIDGEGDTLFDEYIKPIKHIQWPQAENINGISPEMVKDKLTFECYKGEVQSIIDSADLIVGYNLNFDIWFLKYSGITIDFTKDFYDVMLKFAAIYGEWSDYYMDYKWQKLTTCASYYCYEWEENAHNSLGDCKATLYCYNKLIKNEGENDE